MTKAESVYTRINEMVAGGATKADAFRDLAEELRQPIGTLRGAYYQHSRAVGQQSGIAPRTRRRETTPEDALADARAVFERALAAVDTEVEAAERRAKESAEEAKAMKASAKARKDAITARLEQLGWSQRESIWHGCRIDSLVT